MEPHPTLRRPEPLPAVRPTAEKSFVDSLFDMPEGGEVKGEGAEASRLEARLAAEMRALIAARLRSDEAA